MKLSQDVHGFSGACERLLAAGAVYRPLSVEERQMIEYYCRELLKKVCPDVTKANNIDQQVNTTQDQPLDPH